MNGKSQSYDAIIIGSGISGLTVASLLSRVAKRRVLVLERHFKLGGFTHSFRRKEFEWDVGLHYVGNMDPGASTRQFMDLVTGGGVQWRRIADPFDQFVYPDLQVDVPGDERAYRDVLASQFPGQRTSIDRYFQLVHQAAGWTQRYFASKTMPRMIGRLLAPWRRSLACSTTAQVLDRAVSDPRLRAVLASQWGNYGLPPGKSAFAVHALIAADYFRGGFYPEEGSSGLARSIVPIIEASGGACLVNHEVFRLEVHGNRVTKVLCRHKGEEVPFTAPVIVSAMGARNTYENLIPKHLGSDIRAYSESEPPPPTAVTLYLGLNDDPRQHGFREGNYWIYDGYDHERVVETYSLLTRGVVHQCFLSFPSLRMREAKHHTAELITIGDFSSWSRWAKEPWLNRGEEYQVVKDLVGNAMLDFVSRFLPNLRPLIKYSELSTPLTVESMTGHSGGAIYGTPATPARFRGGWFPIQTPLGNLWLTGADVGTLGINGAMMSGVLTTARLLGPLGFPKLLSAAKRYAR